MKSIAFTLLLILQVAVGEAAPIAFTSQNYTTFAQAGVGGSLDGPFNDSSPPSNLPITSSASLTTADGSAEATATADNFFLSAATAATGINDTATAIAVATFTGDFTASGGPLSLMANFTNLGIGTQLFVTLDIGGFTLFNDAFTVSELINQSIFVPSNLAGATGILDLTLTSIADVLPTDTSSNSANVRFSLNSAVPEPSVFADLLIGLALLAIFHLKTGVRPSP